MSEELVARIKRLEERQDAIEQRHEVFVTFISEELNALGDYKNRTDSELSSMDGKIDQLTKIATLHQGIFEDQENRDRAKAVNRRLKNHQTRLNKEKNNRKSK
ncbi:hypothetical protein [Vibrio harveyi]|uniref:hypothetical protein n=1 Tax=Vibrio harveyi TaxID=669 RepID=UPI00237FA15B|nr:hypothetical protein [Vibrio harveyi]WDZ71983.1 hypothetical protein PWW31_13165 [Vibrio harveyi]HDM8069667.1 hypothetical protein [Vibrio harveyi]